MPQHICKKCVSDLQIAFAYKIRCEKSDAKLRDYFREHLNSAHVKLEEIDLTPDQLTECDWMETAEMSVVAETVSDNNYHQTWEESNDDGYSHPNFETFTPSDDDESAKIDQKVDVTIDSSHIESADASKNENERDSSPKQSPVGRDSTIEENHAQSTNKGFSCVVCCKPFKFIGDLNRHKIFHDALMADKKFACDICDGKFTRLTNLR